MIQLNLRTTLLSPLSHMSGEEYVFYESNDKRKKRVIRLHTRKTIQAPTDQGTQHFVIPKYQGNSWRGRTRFEIGLAYVNRLIAAGVPITKELFRKFLTPGGMLEARQEDSKTENVKSFYREFPHYWLFGGTLNGQPLKGHSAVSDWIPVTQQTIANHSIPEGLYEQAIDLSAHRPIESVRTPLTDISQITRRDPKLRPDLVRLVDDEELREMLDEYETKRQARQKAKTSAAVPHAEASQNGNEESAGASAAEQQILASETVWEGTQFFGTMNILDGEGDPKEWRDLQELALGHLLLGLERFAEQPYIGGGYRQGYGKVACAIDVAFDRNDYIKDAITISFDQALPVFGLHDRMRPYRKKADEAMAQIIDRLAAAATGSKRSKKEK